MGYTVGDVLPFAAEVRNPAGALVNPGAMALTVTLTLADGTVQTTVYSAIAPTSTGLFDKDHATTLFGRYVGYWQATGANAGAHTQTFEVAPADDRTLVSLAAVKKQLGMTATTHDDELELMIQSATNVVEDKVGTVARRTIVGERHDGGCGAVYLDYPPVISVTTVSRVVGGALTVAANLLELDGLSGRVEYADGYTNFPYGAYRFTYESGRVVVDPAIQLAALVLTKGMWETQRGSGVRPGLSVEELMSLPGMGIVMGRVELLLKPFLLGPGSA